MMDRTARPFPSALATSRSVLRALVVLNLVVGVLIAVLWIASLIASDWVFRALGVKTVTATLGFWMRLIMVVGMASTPLTHVLLTRLLAMIETVRAGDPFVAENAIRLQTCAWALFGLQCLHLSVGLAETLASTPSQPIDLNWNFSVAGWLAVLLLFVLARVFDHGTRMRDDLAGTV